MNLKPTTNPPMGSAKPDLSKVNAKAIINAIQAHPVAEARSYGTPAHEASGDPDVCFFGVIKRGKTHHVWCYDDYNGDLCWEGAFPSEDEACEYAAQRAKDAQEAGKDALEYMKDQAWEMRVMALDPSVGPFTFIDVTHHQDRLELKNEADVFAYFSRNAHHLRRDGTEDVYGCYLSDGHGRPCWLARNHRGEMIIEVEHD